MIKHVVGDMLDFTNDAPDFIVHQTNCEGRMGGGIAKTIKEKFPKVYVQYLEFLARERFEGKTNLLGEVSISTISLDYRKVGVLNVYAQDACSENKAPYKGGRYTSYDALCEGLKLVRDMFVPQLTSSRSPVRIWMPEKIGCVKGGGDPDVVSAIIKSVFDNPEYADKVELSLFTLPEKPKGIADAL